MTADYERVSVDRRLLRNSLETPETLSDKAVTHAKLNRHLICRYCSLESRPSLLSVTCTLKADDPDAKVLYTSSRLMHYIWQFCK